MSLLLARVDLQVEGNLILAKMFFPPVELIFHNHNFEFDSGSPVSLTSVFMVVVFPLSCIVTLQSVLIYVSFTTCRLLKQVLFTFVLLADIQFSLLCRVLCTVPVLVSFDV